LGEIQEKKRQQDSSSDLRHKLDETMIHELNVRDAPVMDVIEILRTESEKASANKTAINFVWQAPESSKAVKVTLNLHNIPLADVLKYVTESAGLRYRADTHAVVIYKPLPTVPKESAPANVKPE
jgi:general secretion pathway protein D